MEAVFEVWSMFTLETTFKSATFPVMSASPTTCRLEVGLSVPIPTLFATESTKRVFVSTAKFEEMATSPEKAWTFVCAIYKYRTIFLAVWDAPKKMDVLGILWRDLISSRSSIDG